MGYRHVDIELSNPVGALVLGDEVLLGAVPMEDMDWVVCPSLRTVDVNPRSPNFPRALVK